MATVINVRQTELNGSTARSTETTTTIDAFSPTNPAITTGSIPTALLSAAVNIEPQKTLFKTTTINGRPLGDINNDGLVTTADSSEYQEWTAGLLTDPAEQAAKLYIENVFNPYLLANPVTYSVYVTAGLIPRNEAVTFVQQIDNTVLPNAIYLKAVATNIPGTPNCVWSYSTDLAPNTWTVISGQSGDTLTLTNTVYMSYLGTATSVNFKVECSKLDYVTSTATLAVRLEKEINDIINTYVTPETVIVQTDSDGVVLSYSNTGTAIQVAVNGRLLDYGTSPNNFSIGTPSVSGLTLGSGSGTAKTYTYGPISNFTVDNTNVSYPITITNRFGVSRTAVSVNQQYLKVKQGAAGGTGTKYITIYCFKWDNGATAPTAPTWTATYNWSTGVVTGTPTGYPTGWTGSAPSAPGNGYTLYQLSVVLADVGSATTTTFNWNSAIVGSVGFRQDGTVGFRGDSYKIAFKVTTSNTIPTSPGVVTGDGTPSGWTPTAASSLADGEYQYQVDGIYNIVTDQTTWGIAYLSNLKVGTLSAITTNTGNLVIGENGSIKSFGSGYGSNGIFLGWDGSTYKFSVGKDDSKILYNGTSLTVPAATIAGQLTAGQILVTGQGSAINDDPGCQDITSWQVGGHGDMATQVTVSDGVFGSNVFRSTVNTITDAGSASSIDTVKLYPVSSGKKYRLTAWARKSSTANGTFYLRTVDQAGNQVILNVEGVSLTTGWQKYVTEFVPTSTQKSVKIRAILNWTETPTGYHEVTDLRLEEKVEGDLVVNGSITADLIDSRGLSIKDANGNIVLAAGDATAVNKDANLLRVAYPGGGTLSGPSGTVGAIWIILPQAWSNTMMRFEVEIYEYVTNSVQTYEVGGYNYESQLWHNAYATYRGSPSRVRRVIFGKDTPTGRPVIAIGAFAGSWEHPKVTIKNFVGGYENFGVNQWVNGWNVSFQTSRQYTEQVAIENPTIGGAFSGLDFLTSSNISTYIAQAAIGEAYIGNLSASKITVGRGGMSQISQDSFFSDSSKWSKDENVLYVNDSNWAPGQKNSTLIRCATGQNQMITSVNYYGIDPTQTYSLTALLYRAESATRNMYLFLEFYDTNYSYVGSGSTGWGGSKSGYTFGGVPAKLNQFYRYGGTFGAGTGRPIPSQVRYCKIGVWFQYSEGGVNAEQGAQDLRLDRAEDGGQLTVYGQITADEIDTKNLTIKDANGSIIFSAGTDLDYSRVGGSKPPSDADKTSLNIAASIADQGNFATLSKITSSNVGTYIDTSAIDYNYVGGAKPPSDADKTSLNIAASIADQGSFATLSTITNNNISTYIAAAAISDAYIGSLAANKILAGSLGIGRYIESTNYSSGNSGWRIGEDGNAEFEGIVIRRSQRVTSGTFWVNEKFGYFNGTEYPYSKTILIDTGYTVPKYIIDDPKNTYVFYAGPGGGAGTDVTQWYFTYQADIHINTIVNDTRHFWSWNGATGTLKFSVTVNIENYVHYSNYTGGAGINLDSGIKWGLYKLT